MSYAETQADWPLSATYTVYNIPVPNSHPTAQDIIDYLTTDWEFEDVVVEDFVLPTDTGESYVVEEAQIRFTWGWTDEFRTAHGDFSKPLGTL